jgi:hypothetical protein
MVCNIDGKGRLARLIWGILCLAAGVVMLLRWARPGGGWVAWVVTGVVLFAGAFGVFEWWAGWCVVRAMGVKTRF